jgi:hypothetical protein
MAENFYGKKFMYLVNLGDKYLKLYADSVDAVNDYLLGNGLLDSIDTGVLRGVPDNPEGVYKSDITGKRVEDGKMVQYDYPYIRLSKSAVVSTKDGVQLDNRKEHPIKFRFEFEFHGEKVSIVGADRKCISLWLEKKGYVRRNDQKIVRNEDGTILYEMMTYPVVGTGKWSVGKLEIVNCVRSNLSEEEVAEYNKEGYTYESEGAKVTVKTLQIEEFLAQVAHEVGAKKCEIAQLSELTNGMQRGILKCLMGTKDEKYYNFTRSGVVEE